MDVVPNEILYRIFTEVDALSRSTLFLLNRRCYHVARSIRKRFAKVLVRGNQWLEWFEVTLESDEALQRLRFTREAEDTTEISVVLNGRTDTIRRGRLRNTRPKEVLVRFLKATLNNAVVTELHLGLEDIVAELLDLDRCECHSLATEIDENLLDFMQVVRPRSLNIVCNPFKESKMDAFFDLDPIVKANIIDELHCYCSKASLSSDALLSSRLRCVQMGAPTKCFSAPQLQQIVEAFEHCRTELRTFSVNCEGVALANRQTEDGEVRYPASHLVLPSRPEERALVKTDRDNFAWITRDGSRFVLYSIE